MDTYLINGFNPGALVRIAQICGDPKKGNPGLVPVSAATWWRWVKQGRVPQGRKIGPQVTAWPIEEVLAIRNSRSQGDFE